MILSPRYGEPPVVSVDVRQDGAHPVIRQRQRFEAVLQELTDDEWRQPSRCAGWTVQDVVTHLTSTNAFWALSIGAGVRGEPTTYLGGTFDPTASPAEMVERERGTPVADTLAQFMAGNRALAEVVEALGPADWDALAEAPPGHLPVSLVADHALWDCWVHERDVLLPLGRSPVVDGDEVLTSLRYAAALGRAFELCVDAGGDPEVVVLETKAPDARIVVEVEGGQVRVHDGPGAAGAAHCRGDAVETLEMVSLRDVGAPVPDPIRSLTAGLATTFDQPSVV